MDTARRATGKKIIPIALPSLAFRVMKVFMNMKAIGPRILAQRLSIQ